MSKLIDLSMVIEEGMQTFGAPWHPYVEITQLGRHGIEDRETRKLIIGTHCGTHIDAPRHFIANGITIEHAPLERLCGKAIVVDFSDLEDKTEITCSMLSNRIGSRAFEKIIFRFDWDDHLGTNKYYTDHPYFSEEACEWLVEKKCQLIALDTPQPDNPLNGRGSNNDAPNHKILLSAEIYIAEYLINIRNITKEEVMLFVAPLKIKEGDGAPSRIFVME